MTFAVRPVGLHSGGIQFVTSSIGSALNGFSTTVSIPAHQPGDLIVVVVGTQSLGVQTPSGWNNLVMFPRNSAVGRHGRIFYRFSETGSPSSVTYSSSGSGSTPYSAALIFRNVAGIGSIASTSGSTPASSASIPGLTLHNESGSSAVIGANFIPYISSVTGMNVSSGVAWALNQSSFSSKTATLVGSNYPMMAAIELLARNQPTPPTTSSYWRVEVTDSRSINGVGVLLASIGWAFSGGFSASSFTASSTEAGYPISEARDASTSTVWISATYDPLPIYVQAYLGPTARSMISLAMAAPSDSGLVATMPKSFRIQARTDSGKWITVKEFNNLSAWSANEQRNFTL